MQLAPRLLVAAGWLTLGLGAQAALLVHLNQSDAQPFPELKQQLEAFPRTLGSATPSTASWQGQDQPDLEETRQRLPFHADGLVSRNYRPAGPGPFVTLYMAYSRLGDDRKHHPEVCIREVKGAPEDLRARQRIYVDAERNRAVQRFRFRVGTSEYITVYYWHYTLAAEPNEGQSFLQQMHQRLGQPTPSITVQVASNGAGAELEMIEASFLPAVDAAMQARHLPPNARLGCNRLPIGVVWE